MLKGLQRIGRLSLFLALIPLAHSCELCQQAYLKAADAAPKASALNPQARVVEYQLTVTEQTLSPAGEPALALTVNGSTPAPTLHFREGDVARITVINGLKNETTSMHWHGILLPNVEDGVPLLTTPLIEPGKSRTFEFLIRQSGTYWYHSHTDHQEQRGVYGAIVIEPKTPTLMTDHDEVIVLSDWTNEHPLEVQRTLLRGSDWYAYRKGTTQSIVGAYRAGKLNEYFSREKSLVPPMDISDVAYDAFLMNGKRRLSMPGKPGETIRVRLINAGAATYFYLDAANGSLRVIAADGQDVVAFDQKRLLIGPAETYDVLMKVPPEGSWELRATAQDNSGYASAWFGQGTTNKATPPPAASRYEMDAYLTSVLDQIDPDESHKEFERPLSPYRKIRAAKAHPVAKEYREITLKLTGDMIRYEWSFDGINPHQAESIKVKEGETIRIRLVNNTMMHHPIHFHGHFFRIVNPNDNDPSTSPLKHTIDVPPMTVRTIEFTANEGKGNWLLHCHLLYHHVTGMMRNVSVVAENESGPPHPEGVHTMPNTFAWGQIGLTNASTQAFITVQSDRNNWNIKWSEGMHEGDGHEGELSYQRYIDPQLSLIAGYRFDTMEGGRDGWFGGASVRLPYFIDFNFSHQSGGETRVGLAKSLQITDELALDLGYRYGRKTHASYSAEFRYLLTKTYSLTAGYSSDFGTGVGVIIRF